MRPFAKLLWTLVIASIRFRRSFDTVGLVVRLGVPSVEICATYRQRFCSSKVDEEADKDRLSRNIQNWTL